MSGRNHSGESLAHCRDAIYPNLNKERQLWAEGLQYVAGVDEAGRGAWAGPVVAGSVILSDAWRDTAEHLASVRDSKLLTARARQRCYDLIAAHSVCYGVGSASSQEIDAMGIVPATRLAMRRAIALLHPAPQFLIIDAVRLDECPMRQDARPKADLHHLSVSAASVLAKVTRDQWMVDLSRRLPEYGFERHKGYGTRAHRAALQQHGPAEQHRQSFAPIRDMLQLAWL